MGRDALGLLLLVTLGGCGLTTSPDRPVARGTLASFIDTGCRDVARRRADDAALNGYDDAALQARITRDAYDSCIGQHRGSAGASLAMP